MIRGKSNGNSKPEAGSSHFTPLRPTLIEIAHLFLPEALF